MDKLTIIVFIIIFLLIWYENYNTQQLEQKAYIQQE